MSKPIPTVRQITVKKPIDRMYAFHGQMTGLAKKAVGELHTLELEGLLENFSLLMAGDYGEQESVEFPVDVVRETALFASVALSRLLWERYKLEKSLGRSVVDREPNLPDKKDLTNQFSETIFGEEDNETQNQEEKDNETD